MAKIVGQIAILLSRQYYMFKRLQNMYYFMFST